MLDGTQLNTMNKEQLEALENEVNAELYNMAAAEKSIHEPITDGVVDIHRYLASSPKILWILKEPWEDLKDGEAGGGWSLTNDLIPSLITKNQIGGIPTYRKMAYVTFSVFNNFTVYSGIPYANEDPKVGESLKNIAYINVSKFPGKSSSNPATIEFYHRRNRDLLKKQVATINPDIVIAGNILHLFYEDFGFARQDLTSAGTSEFCLRNGRLYINAYHPSYWACDEATYVIDLVVIIKTHSPTLPVAIVNRQS
jgi:hypothetical protein